MACFYVHKPWTLATVNEGDDDKPEKKTTDTMSGGFSFGATKPGSGKRTLKAIKTHFYVGTEDGEIVYVDWMPQKDQDSGKIQSQCRRIFLFKDQLLWFH